ncbi:GNAT family N-acetyltransferase [Devosia nitrariae]|uniref:Acetyltransferase n=1 Tax=Devosia nitrariae TaxID=2071872 RepID=A0ABQ5WBP6_9HYPH|nr:GNAT family N-acetyltransferase [Devosia nitrariae]GLQ57143.1 acetyltransferase [Devosia nitrariae]
MTQALHIRPAEESDLQVLLDLYAHLDARDLRCPPDEAIRVFRRFQLYPGSTILVGFVGKTMVTSCTLVVIPNLTRGGRSYGLIENVVTHSHYRNRGFGKALLDAAAERAWAEDCYKVMLMTGSKTPATLAFYASAGFEQTKTGFQMRRHPAREG